MVFVSATALAFEVALTRICSVLLQYHLSFAVVSMAVLGVGLGGFAAWALVVRAERRGLQGADSTVAQAALLAFGPALVLALVVLMCLPFASAWPALLPFVLPAFACAGAFQSLALRAYATSAGRLYAADLLGGATGALLSVVAIGALGGPVNTTLVLAMLASALAWFWTREAGRLARVAPSGLALTLIATLAQALFGLFAVDYGRAPHKLLSASLRPSAQGTPHLLPQLARWDAYSRVDVLELDSPRGLQRLVFIDGETPTPMLQVDPTSPNAAGVGVTDALAALPFRLTAPKDVLSIGSGGGYDVVTARRFGATRIDAVELNAGVLAVVDAARDFTGDVYRQPGVTLHHAEGRQFARRAPAGMYDLLVLALAQSLAGNLQEYALSENYLYTREAFADYLRVLKRGGVIVLLVSNPMVQAKLVGTARDVLKARGVATDDCILALVGRGEVPYDHLVMVRSQPFTATECDAIEREVEARRYGVVHVPRAVRVPQSLLMPPVRASTRLVSAVDEKPFFFHLEPGTPSGLTLLLSGACVALGLACGAFGLAIHRDSKRRAPAVEMVRTTAYFVLLGLGFLMVEVLVLQRTILFLGYPTLNLAVVLASFLVGAGCGSLASDRLARGTALRVWLGGLALALAGLMPLLSALHAPLDSVPLGIRCAVVVAILLPFAFVMGMPFPAGVRRLAPEVRTWVPWFWGLNGIASITGSALVVAVVLERGFRLTGLLPAVVYLLAAVAIPASQGTGAARRRAGVSR